MRPSKKRSASSESRSQSRSRSRSASPTRCHSRRRSTTPSTSLPPRSRSRRRSFESFRSRSPSPVVVCKDWRPTLLLSLDGGGVRGLSAVMMLKYIMKQVNAEREIKLEPYQVFDLMGGTSTGGYVITNVLLSR